MKIYHGDIVSCNADNGVFKYLVEDGGRILYAGNELAKKYRDADAEIIELGGRALLPGFGDGHLHFSSWSLINSTLDVREAGNIPEILEKITEYSINDPKMPVILVFGHSMHNLKEKRLITRAELDTVNCGRPVIVVCYDGHSAVGNSALMEKFPDEIKKLRGFNYENGQLFNEAYLKGMDFATGMVPTMRLLKGILKGVDDIAARGISMVHPVEGIGFPRDMDVDLVRTAAKSAEINFRIFFQTMEVEKVLKRKLPRIGGCFATALDGCFGAVDAALIEPYSNDPENRGILFYSDEEVISFAKKANRAGLQIAFHAIGDAAVAQAVRAIGEALKDFPREDHRHTLIHACLIQEDDLKRIAALGIGITLQPAILIFPLEPQEYLEKILGGRAAKNSPLQQMLDMGIHVSGGSDAPVTPPDPVEGIYAACNHPNPEYSVSIPDALRMFTHEPAYTSFDEKERGTLETGKIADMVILNKNPLMLRTEDLRELKIDSVLLKGKLYKGGRGILGMLAGMITGRKRKL